MIAKQRKTLPNGVTKLRKIAEPKADPPKTEHIWETNMKIADHT